MEKNTKLMYILAIFISFISPLIFFINAKLAEEKEDAKLSLNFEISYTIIMFVVGVVVNIITFIVPTIGMILSLAYLVIWVWHAFIDYKAMTHAFRSAYQVLHIIEDGGFEYPLPETKFIKEVKYGKLQYKDLSDNLEILIDEVYSKLKFSNLSDKPDYDWVNNFVYNQYKLYH